MIRKAVAAALAAAVLVPTAAQATGGCWPRFREERVEVAGQTYTYLMYDGMIC